MEIDVKKCPHYEYGIGYNEGVLYKYCNQCDDCMYKTFQQLKAENEALTEQLDDEMLKTVQLANEIVELNKYIDRAGIIGIIKVLKCLDEIEEMTLAIRDEFQSINCEKYKSDCDKCESKDTCFGYRILQKIKEVKGNG